MRVRFHDREVAAAFMGLARLRPDVVLAPVPASGAGAQPAAGGQNLFDVGLVGSFSSEQRATEVAALVRGWTSQLAGGLREVGVEVVS